MKYAELLEALEDEQIYSPSMIANFAAVKGFLTSESEETRKIEKQRIRIAMGRFSNSRDFPDQGDHFVTLKGQAPTPGWYGWRWKEACQQKKWGKKIIGLPKASSYREQLDYGLEDVE